jgi:cyclic pyranopterin phosphate synthase
MPEEGIVRRAHDELLTYEELTRLCRLFSRRGARKIRITGGEPLVRRGLLPWLAEIAGLPERPELLLTTNGVLLHRHLDELREVGIRRINLSLDTLDPVTWRRITRREGFAEARRVIDAALAAGFGLKINVVVQPGYNDGEILEFVDLAREKPVTVRFIEPMPFVGVGATLPTAMSGKEILAVIAQRWPVEVDAGTYNGVALTFELPGFLGQVGIIEGHSRSFCSSCSRLRIDPLGGFRTCLYGEPVLDLRELLRSGAHDAAIEKAVGEAISDRPFDGRAALGRRTHFESMASIGG